MADSLLTLELEMKAKFDSFREAGEQMRATLRGIKGEVQENLGPSFESASLKGEELASVLQQIRTGVPLEQIKVTGKEVRNNLTNSFQTASVQGAQLNNVLQATGVQGSQLTNVVRQLRAGLVQLSGGSIVGGLLTIFQGFQRLGEQSAKLAPGIKGVAGEVGALGATAGKSATALGGFSVILGALGPIGIAVIAVLVLAIGAIAALVIGTNKIIDTAKDVGNKSREAFDKFKAGVEAAGGTITLLDRKLSQNLTATVAKVQGAFDRIFIEVLRATGPALIGLLNSIAAVLVKLIPLASAVGTGLAFGFDSATAAINTILVLMKSLRQNFLLTIATFSILETFAAEFKKARAASEAAAGGAGDATGGFKDKKKKEKEAKDFRLQQLELEKRKAKEIFDEEARDAERAFDQRVISSQALTDRLIANAETLRKKQEAIFEQQRAVLNSSKLPEQERLLKLAEFQQDEQEALNAHNAAIQKINDEAQKREQHSFEHRNDFVKAVIAVRAKLNQRLLDLEVEARKTQLETDQAELANKRLGPSARLGAEADLAIREAALVTFQRVEQLKADRDFNLQLATNANERLAVSLQSHFAIEEELRRHAAVVTGIQDELRKAQERLDPFSARSLLGEDFADTLAATGSLIEAVGAKIQGQFTAITSSAQAMSIGVNLGLKVMFDSLTAVTGALGKMLTQWVLTGKTGPAAIRQLLAAQLAAIAQEAAIQAIYATALGFLRLAQHDFVAAGQAFISAGFWAALAGGTAVAGRAIAGDSGQQGGGSGSSVNTQQQQRPTEIQIQRGDITGQIGGEQQAPLGRLVSAIERLNGIVETSAPGDVLTRAVDQNPGAVAKGVRSSLASDPGFIRDVGLAVERG